MASQAAILNVPKFTALFNQVQRVKRERQGVDGTLGKRIAVYSNFNDVCEEVHEHLNQLLGPGQVMHLTSETATDVLVKWHRVCRDCKFMNIMSASDECTQCKGKKRGFGLEWVLVIDSDQREGIDVFGCHELHLLDPCLKFADEVQVKARIRRTLDPCRMDVRLDRSKDACVDARGVTYTHLASPDNRAGCCAVNIRYLKYHAAPSLSSVQQRFLAWFELVDQPAAAEALTVNLSYDAMVEQRNAKAMGDLHGLIAGLTAPEKPGYQFNSSYSCEKGGGAGGSASPDMGCSKGDHWCGLKPMKHQLDALHVFKDTVKSGRTDMLLIHGAGTGKTLTSMGCAHEWGLKYPGGKVVLVTPTASLAEQWRQAPYLFQGESILYKDARTKLPALLARPEVLIIFDEAHYLLRLGLRDAILGTKTLAFALMVTATPVQSDISDVSRYLSRGTASVHAHVELFKYTPTVRKGVNAAAVYTSAVMRVKILATLVLCVMKVGLLLKMATSGQNLGLVTIPGTPVRPDDSQMSKAVQAVTTTLSAFSNMPFFTPNNYVRQVMEMDVKNMNSIITTQISSLDTIIRNSSEYQAICYSVVKRVLDEVPISILTLLSSSVSTYAPSVSTVAASILEPISSRIHLMDLSKSLLQHTASAAPSVSTVAASIVEPISSRMDLSKSVLQHTASALISSKIPLVDLSKSVLQHAPKALAGSSFIIHDISPDIATKLLYTILTCVALAAIKALTTPTFDPVIFIRECLTDGNKRVGCHVFANQDTACVMPMVSMLDEVVHVALTPVQMDAGIRLGLNAKGVSAGLPQGLEPTTDVLEAGVRLAYFRSATANARAHPLTAVSVNV